MFSLLQALVEADPQILRVVIAVTNAVIALTALLTASARLYHYFKKKGTTTMATKGTTNATKKREVASEKTEVDDFLAGELSGEFSDLPERFANTAGVIARLAIAGGGYFGLSVSDDGVSAKLTIHRGSLRTERRFYRLADLEAALAKCLEKLR